jgi:hypothetical protein
LKQGVDSDGDGFISRDEMSNSLARMFLPQYMGSDTTPKMYASYVECVFRGWGGNSTADACKDFGKYLFACANEVVYNTSSGAMSYSQSSSSFASTASSLSEREEVANSTAKIEVPNCVTLWEKGVLLSGIDGATEVEDSFLARALEKVVSALPESENGTTAQKNFTKCLDDSETVFARITADPDRGVGMFGGKMYSPGEFCLAWGNHAKKCIAATQTTFTCSSTFPQLPYDVEIQKTDAVTTLSGNSFVSDYMDIASAGPTGQGQDQLQSDFQGCLMTFWVSDQDVKKDVLCEKVEKNLTSCLGGVAFSVNQQLSDSYSDQTTTSALFTFLSTEVAIKFPVIKAAASADLGSGSHRLFSSLVGIALLLVAGS